MPKKRKTCEPPRLRIGNEFIERVNVFSAKLTLLYCDEREIQSSERSIDERIV